MPWSVYLLAECPSLTSWVSVYSFVKKDAVIPALQDCCKNKMKLQTSSAWDILSILQQKHNFGNQVKHFKRSDQ